MCSSTLESSSYANVHSTCNYSLIKKTKAYMWPGIGVYTYGSILCTTSKELSMQTHHRHF